MDLMYIWIRLQITRCLSLNFFFQNYSKVFDLATVQESDVAAGLTVDTVGRVESRSDVRNHRETGSSELLLRNDSLAVEHSTDRPVFATISEQKETRKGEPTDFVGASATVGHGSQASVAGRDESTSSSSSCRSNENVGWISIAAARHQPVKSTL